MGKHYCDAKARCPYYLHEDRQMIYCEGIRGGTTTHVAFADCTECKAHKYEYCRCGWEKCPVARMLSEKYKEENDG